MAGSDTKLSEELAVSDPFQRESFCPPSTPSPSSGVVSGQLFDGDSGPGYWVDEDPERPFNIEFENPLLASGEVLRLSPAALWFVPREGAHFPPREIRFHLKRGDWSIGPLRGKIVHLGGRTSRPCIGLKIIGVPLTAGKGIVAFMNELVQRGAARIAHEPSPVLEEIVDAERICSILSAISVVGSGGALSIRGKTVRASIIHADPETRTVYWKTEERVTPPTKGDGAVMGPGESIQASIIGYNSVYRFQLNDVRSEGDTLVAPHPDKVDRVRHRTLRRVPVAAALRIRFEHPLWAEIEPVWRNVMDISLGGIRFATSLDEDLLFPALSLPYIEIETEFGTVIHLRGQVRNVLPARGEAPASCGASVTPLSPEDEIRWMRLVTGMLYNHTTQTSEHLSEPLWDLFKDSGYMNLAGKSAEHFTYLKRRFVSVSQRAASAPQLICQAVWPSDRGVEATVSFCKAYKQSWMGHQLAKRKSLPSSVTARTPILWSVYTRAFEHSQSDPDMRWTMGYVEGTVPWIARTHLAFVARYEATNEAVAMPVRMMSVSCAESGEPQEDEFDIGPATPWEKLRALAVIARTRPQGYREALDFTSTNVDLNEVSRDWRRFGFEREREIFIARRGTKPVAALVVECGEIGTNLFCLLDSARLFSLTPRGSDAYVQLMDEARAWFSARRRSSFLFFREDDDTSYEKAARLHDEPGQPYLFIISARLLPDFLEHICEVAGSRSAAS
jgi:hypothetical protein